MSIYNYDCVYMYGVCRGMSSYMWTSEDNLVSSILPFHTYMSPKDPTMIFRLTQEALLHTQSSHWPDTIVYSERFSSCCVELRALIILANWVSSPCICELVRFPLSEELDRVSLYCPVCPETHSRSGCPWIHRDLPASAFWLLGLKECSVRPHSGKVSYWGKTKAASRSSSSALSLALSFPAFAQWLLKAQG